MTDSFSSRLEQQPNAFQGMVRLLTSPGTTGNGASDDTLGWTNAIALAESMTPGGLLWLDPGHEFTFTPDLLIPSNVVILGGGSEQTGIKCLGSGRLMFGPDPLIAGAQQQFGVHGGFAIDGQHGPTHPLYTNSVGAIYRDIIAANGTDAAVAILGQNNHYIGGSYDSVVLDNGCGGNRIDSEIHGPNPGNGHLISILKTHPPSAGSYPVPTNNYFRHGIAEFTAAGKSCVYISAGQFNYFDLWNFFTNANNALVFMELNAGADSVGRLYFRDCQWTGNGAQPPGPQVGVQIHGFNGDFPIVLEGDSIVSGLAQFVQIDVNTTIVLDGQISPFNIPESQLFKSTLPLGAAPIWFAEHTDPNAAVTLGPNYTGGITIYRHRGRVWMDGVITTIAAPNIANKQVVTISDPHGFASGQNITFTVAGSSGAFFIFTLAAGGNIFTIDTVPSPGEVISFSGLSWRHSTYG